MPLVITYPLGHLRNFVAKEADGSNGHYYTENKSLAVHFESQQEAETYIDNHKWLRDMYRDSLIKIAESR